MVMQRRPPSFGYTSVDRSLNGSTREVPVNRWADIGPDTEWVERDGYDRYGRLVSSSHRSSKKKMSRSHHSGLSSQSRTTNHPSSGKLIGSQTIPPQDKKYYAGGRRNAISGADSDTIRNNLSRQSREKTTPGPSRMYQSQQVGSPWKTADVREFGVVDGIEQLRESRMPSSPRRTNLRPTGRSLTPSDREEPESHPGPPTSPRFTTHLSRDRQGSSSMQSRGFIGRGSPQIFIQQSASRYPHHPFEVQPQFFPCTSPRQPMPRSTVEQEGSSVQPRNSFACYPIQHPIHQSSKSHRRRNPPISPRHQQRQASGPSCGGVQIQPSSSPFQDHATMALSLTEANSAGFVSSPFLESDGTLQATVKGREPCFRGGKLVPPQEFLDDQHVQDAFKGSSDEPEDWLNSDENWHQAPNSHVDEGNNGHWNDQGVVFVPSATLNGVKSSSSIDRDKDVLETATKKKEKMKGLGSPSEADDFRERDTLMVAREKIVPASPPSSVLALEPSPNDVHDSRAANGDESELPKWQSRENEKQLFSGDTIVGTSLGYTQVAHGFGSSSDLEKDLEIFGSTTEEFFDAVSGHPNDLWTFSTPGIGQVEDEAPKKQRKKSFFKATGAMEKKNSTKEMICQADEPTADPMQMSGLKLLAAAIIPVQAEVRRFLAMRHALTRMWALIIIQTYCRKWISQKRFSKVIESAIAIQATLRGKLTRDALDFRHGCAIEVQRITRGYLATMRVYEDIYRVTMIQSYVRMKQATSKATLRLASIIQVQSVVRGFLTRHQQDYEKVCTVAIQANWRRFYTRLNYQFDLLDVIIAQSVCRRKLAIWKLRRMESNRLEKAAIVIQTRWRQYDCRMKCLQSIADILIAQSAVRRYLAIKRAHRMKYKNLILFQAIVRGFSARKIVRRHIAARKIQSAWRGFVSYADYMFLIADVVTAQKFARIWLATRAADRMRDAKWGATIIQSACRVVLCKAKARRVAIVRELARMATKTAEKEDRAATSIQTLVRGLQTRSAYMAYLAARKIQAFWRCRNLRNGYTCYRAAVTIQSRLRAMKARQDIVILRGEVLAATLIQSAWRGFLSYTDYIFTVSDVVTVQKVSRGFLTRRNKGIVVTEALSERRKRINAATSVQKGCRGLLARQKYWYTLGCTMQIQSWIRGRLVMLQLRREEKARLRLQSVARRYLSRQEYVQKKFIFLLRQSAEQERLKKVAALVIQDRARKYMHRRKRDGAAQTIQRFFLLVRIDVKQIVQASKRRRHWRKQKPRKDFDVGNNDLLEDAWVRALSSSSLGNDSIVAQTISRLGSSTYEDWCHGEGHDRSQRKKRGKICKKDSIGAKGKNSLPPSCPYTSSSSTALRVNHGEEAEYSKLRGPTTAFYRLPPARTKNMDSREMSDDLELEEAYLDAEIHTAKGRRIANEM